MSANSKIEWTHHTFNPWWGCEKVSPACAFCYAERNANRFAPGLWGKDGQRRFFGDKHWNEPLLWNKASGMTGRRDRVFCASMADVFEDREDLMEDRYRLLLLIEATPNLDWLLLTKRPQNIARMIAPTVEGEGDELALTNRWLSQNRNVWLGTTAEDQQRTNERILHLLRLNATVRFLSCEPLLGPIDLRRIPAPIQDTLDVLDGERIDGGTSCICEGFDPIGWVIVGGESGPRARPTHPDWVRGIATQCRKAGVPFFFKQWGEYLPADSLRELVGFTGPTTTMHASEDQSDEPVWIRRVGKKAAGRLLDGREWNEFPQPKG